MPRMRLLKTFSVVLAMTVSAPSFATPTRGVNLRLDAAEEKELQIALQKAYSLYDTAGVQYDDLRRDRDLAESQKTVEVSRLCGNVFAAFVIVHELAKGLFEKTDSTIEKQKYHLILERNYWRMNEILNVWLESSLEWNARYKYKQKYLISPSALEQTEEHKALLAILVNSGTVGGVSVAHFYHNFSSGQSLFLIAMILVPGNYHYFKALKRIRPLMDHVRRELPSFKQAAFGDFVKGMEQGFLGTGITLEGLPEGYQAWLDELNRLMDEDRQCYRYLTPAQKHRALQKFPHS